MTDVPGDLGGTEIPYGGVTADAPEYEIKETTIDVQSLLSISGIRFVFSSFVSNFAAFTVVAVTLVAMAGVGAAEHAGMMAALIRKLVAVAPAGALTFILVLVGVVSSVATDAGYLILIPLGAAAFASVGRHPLAGLAASFAGVAAVFGANLLITPSDSMLTEITNETILANGGTAISVTANLYFSIVSSLVLAGVAALITTRMIEPRLGKWKAGSGDAELAADAEPDVDTEGEKRGLRFALVGLLVMTALVLVMTVPSGAPLRDAETDAIIGDTPFMASLIFLISLTFLVCGVCYGIGARTVKSSNDVIGAIGKTYASLGGLLLMFLMIAQFIAFFNYTNMPRVAAVEMANALESANVSALLLLIGFILVIVLLDFILPGLVPKWAIFAPVFIPIFDRLGVAPQTVLAAYRVGDSPVNTLTPLMVYFPFIVTIARRYDKNAGIGSIIALMIPYAVILLIAWSALFAAWFALGIPLGPDSPVRT
jgi:aminobenzoyl-glutamate transport protein